MPPAATAAAAPPAAIGVSLPPLVLPPPPVPAPPTGSTPADGLLVATGVTEAAGAGAEAGAVGTTLGAGDPGVLGGVLLGGVLGGVLLGGVLGGVLGDSVQVHFGDTVAAEAALLNITVDPAARSGTLSAAVAIILRGRLDRKFIPAPFLSAYSGGFTSCDPAARQHGRWRNTELLADYVRELTTHQRLPDISLTQCDNPRICDALPLTARSALRRRSAYRPPRPLLR